MLASRVRRLTIGFGLLFVVPAACHGDEPGAKSVPQLQREVGERERQATRAQRELAEARARLALAEGKRDLAVAELRKAVAGHQGEVDWIRDHANWFCDPREPMTAARWDLAKTRVWLAEVEGDAATLVAAWKTIVGFHEQELERVQRLEQLRAVTPADVGTAGKALAQARQHLAAAEKRLTAGAAK